MVDKGKLRAARKKAGMTQQELAVKAGVVVATVAKLEAGKGIATRHDTVAAIAAALDLEVRDLVAPPQEAAS